MSTTTPESESAHLTRYDGSLRSLWFQSAGLLIALLAGLFLTNGFAAVPDEGVYLAQAKSLASGSWASDRPAPDVDIHGMFVPVSDGGVSGDQVVPYSRHPLYPALLAPAFAVAGTTGALAISVIGTWGAALAGAFIARRVRPGFGPWTLWILGLASPLIFDAYTAIGHSLGAAAAGVAFLGLTRAVDDRSWGHLAYGLPAVLMCVGLRSEGLLFAVALGLALGIMALGWPPLKHIDWTVGFVGAAVILVAGATYFAETAVVRSILGDSTGDLSPAARLSSGSLGVVGGIWASLLRPFADSWIDATVSVPLVATALILAAIAIKIAPSRTVLPLGLLLLAAGASLGLLVAPPDLVSGLIPAFPLLLAGLLLLRWHDLRSPLVSRAVIVSVLTTAAVLATNYRIGGATEWGGRFLHILLPVLVPLAVVGLDNGRRALSRREVVVASCALLVVCICLSSVAVRTLMDYRARNRELVTRAVDQAVAATGGGDPLLVVATVHPEGISRVFWDEADNVDVLASGDLRTVNAIMLLAADADRRKLTIVTNASPDLMRQVVRPALQELHWTVLRSSLEEDIGATVLTVGEPD